MKLNKRRRTIAFVLVSLVLFLAVSYVILGRTSMPYDFVFLHGRNPTDTGIRHGFVRGHSPEFYEYRLYNWKQPFADSKETVHSELSALGFRAERETDRYKNWIRDDVEVHLYSQRIDPRADPDQYGTGIQNPGWTLLMVTRVLDYSWVTMFREWLFGPGEPS